MLSESTVFAVKDNHTPALHTVNLTDLLSPIHAFFFIRTSKFWPSLIVLKFLHNLSLICS